MSVLKIRDPKTGLWQEINTIMGPQGPQGIQGEVGLQGPQGPKGDDGFIKFEELTDEQKEELRGPQGIPGPKGNDGYTPVKGVDYFDGEDGPAGEDGYTPVKGVDYFTEEEKTEMLSDYYTKTDVNDLISNLTGGISLQIVETLPTENIDTNTIYLMLKEESFLNDYYDEYMYINSRWELIGNTRVDLTGLAAADIFYDDSALDITIPTVQAAINHLLENMFDEADVDNLLADKGYVNEERVNELITAALGSITNAEEVSY